jgi:hypothetical protein
VVELPDPLLLPDEEPPVGWVTVVPPDDVPVEAPVLPDDVEPVDPVLLPDVEPDEDVPLVGAAWGPVVIWVLV